MWRMKASRSTLEKLSKTVFNAEHRLSIVRALQGTDGLTTTAAIVEVTGIAYSTVHGELNLLSDLGVLQRVAPERQVLFQRLPGPFWDWCTALIGSIAVVEQEQV